MAGGASEEFGADGRGIAGDVHFIFHADRDAVEEAEWAAGAPPVGARARLGEDVVAIDGNKGAQGRSPRSLSSTRARNRVATSVGVVRPERYAS